jgi:hypothetical protein
MQTTTLVLAATMASASAFVAPSAFSGKAFSAVKSSASVMKMGFENELGAQAPLGFFDPLGLSKNIDQAKFDRWRYIEIKHGRIAMLAVLGYISQCQHRLPGLISTSANLSFADVPNGYAALNAIPAAGVAQIVMFIGFLELFFMKSVPGTGNEHVGDFRNGAIDFGWDSFDAQTKLQKRAIELNNGRAAMMGILGILMHEQINGRPFIINDLLGIDYSMNP